MGLTVGPRGPITPEKSRNNLIVLALGFLGVILYNIFDNFRK